MESLGVRGIYLQEGCWYQGPHEGWDIGYPKQEQEHCSAHQEIWGQEEAQANQDDSARLNGVMGDNCMPEGNSHQSLEGLRN